MAAAMVLGKALIEKDNEKMRKRGAIAMDVFLDNETQKKFLRVTTNQELEMYNAKLTTQLEDKDEECGHWYTEAHSLDRKNKSLTADLIVAEDEGDAMKKKITELQDALRIKNDSA